MKTTVGICPKCHNARTLTRHHIKPSRFFGRKNNNEVFLLCWHCHCDLEKMIPQKEKKSLFFYYDVIRRFLSM